LTTPPKPIPHLGNRKSIPYFEEKNNPCLAYVGSMEQILARNPSCWRECAKKGTRATYCHDMLYKADLLP